MKTLIMKKRSFLLSGVCAAAALAMPLLAHAQAFPPSKTVTILVGFAPGGAADATARLVASKLGENLGISVVVENKAGAGGNIAHQQVAQGVADGSLLLLGSVGPLTVAPHMMKVGYDPIKDLAPITMAVNFPSVLVVNKDLPIKNFKQFIDYAKANPGKVDYGSTGHGSASHMSGELLADTAKIDIVHIPYKGGAPALQDLVAGRLASYFAVLNTVQPYIDTDRVTPIATSGAKRMPALPNVPTVAESGYPDYVTTNWYAFVASSKVPEPILERWNTELVKVLKMPDVVDHLNKQGTPAAPGTRKELAQDIARESAMWERLIRERKIVMQ
jgi:tripartite-type tricarboxylate transporter receptor subunit TctC